MSELDEKKLNSWVPGVEDKELSLSEKPVGTLNAILPFPQVLVVVTVTRAPLTHPKQPVTAEAELNEGHAASLRKVRLMSPLSETVIATAPAVLGPCATLTADPKDDTTAEVAGKIHPL